MVEPEIEHEQKTVYEWPDGSRVTQDMYRRHPVAPWTHGPCESYCARCGGDFGPEPESDPVLAVLALTNHIIGHMQDDLAKVFASLGANAGRFASVTYRGRGA